MAPATRPLLRRLPGLGLAALCVLAAGCGGDDDDASSDTEQIARAVDRVMESESVKDQCETGVSERFVREVYVSLAFCREANEPEPDDPPPDSAGVSATRIDGDKATTGVTLTSVKGARATGRVALVNDGGAWKVDRLGVDFLRSVFAALPKEASGAEERRILTCLARAIPDLSDAEVRRLGNLTIGQRSTEGSLPPAAVRCIGGGAEPPPQESTTA